MRTTAQLVLIFSSLLGEAWCQPYVINTIAGAPRLLDGSPANTAPLRSPIAVAVDGSGNLYIADEDDNRIRKVDTSGVISTYAGTGLPGYSGDGGPAIAAALNFPTAIALDAKGNLYIADEGNNRLRRVSVDGTIDTVAGNGNPAAAGDNGPATSAQLDPDAVAVDMKGNVYVADGNNYRIRKIDVNGTITTIAGTGREAYTGDNGPATSATIDFVVDVAVDTAGNVYLADYYNLAIREISADGIITTIAGGIDSGSVDDGVPAIGTVMIPGGLALDQAGNLYLSDENGYHTTVRRINLATGLIYTVAGTGEVGFAGDGGTAIGAELNSPSGLAVSGGVLYFADFGNQRVRKVANLIITTVAGTGIHDNGPATLAFLNFPQGIAIDGAGDIVVADTDNYAVRRFKTGGTINSFGELQGGEPFGVAADKAGNFYVTDEQPTFPSQVPHVLKIQPDGTTSTLAGNAPDGFGGDHGPATVATLNNPQGITVDAAGNIYIADYGNHRVRKIDTTGTISTVAGNGQAVFSGDGGPATSAGLDAFDVAIDGSGNLFVVDQINNRLRKITPQGIITTAVGTGTPGYAGDGGPAVEALLSLPSGIAVDQAGNLYIADFGNSEVRRVNTSGLITTIAGNRTLTPSTGDGGPAAAAQLNPYGVAVDAAGNVYVTDSFNDHVRVLTPLTVRAAAITLVSGDAQNAIGGADLQAPLVLQVTDSTGAGVPGVQVNFSVSPSGAATVQPSPALTLNDGTVSVIVQAGSTPGPVTITASVYGLPSVTFSLNVLAANSPTIFTGGVISAGLSNPRVQALSPNAIVSIFGTNFAPAGTAAQAGLANGQLPTNLAGVCVEFGGVRAPIFALYPSQINAQVPAVAPGTISVQVISGCDTPQTVSTPAISVAAQAAAPEFFYFVTSASGAEPIAAVNAVTGAYVGAPGILSGATFTPAKPGDYLTLYATGFGATKPSFAPGVLPTGTATVTAPVSITFGGVTLDPSQILYVGLSHYAGLYQVNLQVPAGVADGNQPLVITVDGVASPTSAFITVQAAQ